MLQALEEAQQAEMAGTMRLAAAPIRPAARPRQPQPEAPAASDAGGMSTSAAAAAAAQEAATAALGHFKSLLGM
jgi:hypothetical protein